MASVGEIVRRLLPRGTNPLSRGKHLTHPLWPPDMFGLAATLVEASGCYSHRTLGGWGRQSLFMESTYHQRVEALAKGWRVIGSESTTRARAVPGVQELWQKLLDVGDAGLSADPDTEPPAWWRIAVELLAVSDEAAVGIGMVERPSSHSSAFSDYYLEQYKSYIVGSHTQLALPHSACLMIPSQEICVQPKTSTSQVGCTLRSMSHNLALLPSVGEVDTYWRLAMSKAKVAADDEVVANDELERAAPTAPIRPGRYAAMRDRPLNLIAIPFPFRIDGRAFQRIADPPDVVASRTTHGRLPVFFSVAPTWLKEADGTPLRPSSICSYLRGLVRVAKREVDAVHGIVFPELALVDELANSTAEILAVEEPDLELFVAGVSSPGADGGMPTNSVFAAIFGERTSEEKILARWHQPKHHRWKLDGSQIRKYQLGDRLDPGIPWWEGIDIGSRVCNFYSFRPGACLAALVCEDLARIDPVQRVIRAVGPNLVMALLMDGVQAEARWSGQYATVLADDPGCSVLTLTSVGMIRRALIPDGVDNVSVGLWKEPGSKARELRLPGDADALLLTLSITHRQEFALDGRSDQSRAAAVMLTGVYPLSHPERPAWVNRE